MAGNGSTFYNANAGAEPVFNNVDLDGAFVSGTDGWRGDRSLINGGRKDLSALTTGSKSSIVAAINWIVANYGVGGAAGMNGKTIVNGKVDPTSDNGTINDFYLNTVSYMLFGPKTAAGWPAQGVSLIGSIGPKGDQGLQGIQGAQGNAGVQGIPGNAGAKGEQGIQGIQGNQGLKGDTGVTGDVGPKGDQGIQGAKGDTGLTGNAGGTGATGPKGDRGLTGRSSVNLTAIGDSRVDAIYNETTQRVYGSRSPVNWANAMSGNRIVINQTFGKSGDRTDHLFARIDAAIATGAGLLYFQCGVNNIAAVASSGNFTYVHAVTGETVTIATVAAVTYRDTVQLVTKALNAGMAVIVEMEIGANGLTTTEKRAALMDLRASVEAWGRATDGVFIHDAMPLVMQTTDLLFKAGYSYDPTHVNPRGSYVWGKSLANLFSFLVPPINTGLVRNAFELVGVGRRQLILNPIFATGTGGTAGTGTTGDVPSGWTTAMTASTTATTTVAAEATGLGNTVRADINFNAAGSLFRLDQSLSGTSGGAYNAALLAGDSIEAVAKVEIIDPTNLSTIYLYLSVNTGSGGTSYDSMDLFGPGDANNLGPIEAGFLTLRTRPFTIPAAVGAYPFLTVGVRSVGSAAGAASIRIHQCSLRRRV